VVRDATDVAVVTIAVVVELEPFALVVELELFTLVVELELFTLVVELEPFARVVALEPFAGVVVFAESPLPNPPTPETGVGDADVQTVELEIILYGSVEVNEGLSVVELTPRLGEFQACPVTGFLYQLMLGSFKHSPTSAVV
jgi:hypothetical protein